MKVSNVFRPVEHLRAERGVQVRYPAALGIASEDEGAGKPGIRSRLGGHDMHVDLWALGAGDQMLQLFTHDVGPAEDRPTEDGLVEDRDELRRSIALEDLLPLHSGGYPLLDLVVAVQSTAA